MPWCFWGMWASHPNTLPISLAAKISFEQVNEGEEKKKKRQALKAEIDI